MKLIFWNTKLCNEFDVIKSILTSETPDLLFLAEFDQNLLLSNLFTLNSIDYEHYLNPGCDKIIIIKKKNLVNIELSLQHKDYSALYFKKINLYIISLHMPSQMSYNLDALKYNISEFKFEFENYIGNSVEKNILLIGDFNVNPFESPIVHFDGLSATNTRNFNVIKTFRSKQKYIYYNPTWKLYTDNDFPGTFVKKRPSGSVFDVIDHHYLDQVILSYRLKENLISEEIKTLKKTEEYTFCDIRRNKVLLSDHLPLKYVFEIKNYN